MKHVILHIGTSKTGTSSIQEYLRKNSQALSKLNVYYPTKESDNFDHHEIARYFKENKPKIPHLKQQSSFSPSKFQDYVKGLPADATLVLSSEYYFLLNQKSELAQFKKVFPKDIKITIVAYIRNVVAHFESSYAQGVKADGHRHSLPSHEQLPLATLRARGRIDRFTTIQNWSSVFSDASMVVRPYVKSELFNNDVLDDFIRHCGLEKQLGAKLPKLHGENIKANTTPSSFFTENLRILNARGYFSNIPNGKRRRMVSELRRLLDTGKHGNVNFNSYEFIKKIMDEAAAPDKNLCKHYFPKLTEHYLQNPTPKQRYYNFAGAVTKLSVRFNQMVFLANAYFKKNKILESLKDPN